MLYFVFKYLLTAAVIVAASEIAKRSDRLGALIISLPLMTFLTLVWLYAENQPAEKIANHAWYTFFYVIPTLPMFLLFPWLMRQYGFLWAMAGLFAGTAACFALFAALMSRFGVKLW